MNAPQSQYSTPEPCNSFHAEEGDEDALVISIDDKAWTGACGDVEILCRAAAQAVMEARKTQAGVTIVLSNNARMRALNYQFRGRDQPTNVLSFPAVRNYAVDSALSLGDVVLGLETVKSECQKYGCSLDEHLTHLVVHGCLHLLGFDHSTDAEATRMEGLETTILKRLGVPDPYQKEPEDMQ